MPLSWNEIRDRAARFAKDWAGVTSEQAEAQSFWNDFLQVFGVDRRRVAVFEKKVAKFSGKPGRIDLFWPGVLLAEHKSAGKDLDAAFDQATDYFAQLKPREVPRYVIVSDFEHIRLYDLETDTTVDVALADLPKQIRHFGFIAGYQVQQIKPEDPVNLKAAEKMGRLHDQLKAAGYEGHALELLLVRLLFCLFADDTGIFQPAQSFQEWLDSRTAEDGSDLGGKLAEAFQVLNTPQEKRLKHRDEQLAAFPYVNGKLFQETLPIAAFDSAMRETLLDACALDWGKISPAIFGGLFQSIMDAKARRNLGAHYTSEANILKLIKPLFLDELWAEFQRIRHNRNKLFDFHKRLRQLNFLDPACGCGNFLVVAYRELRLLELEILRASRESDQLSLDVNSLIRLDVDQFHGIEIEEFPAQIAQVALWLTDHQMNMRIGEEFGMYFARIPLKSAANIVYGNALRMDWADVVPPNRLSYILGNPPFLGKQYQSADQKADLASVYGNAKGAKELDLVAAWYVKAARYISGHHHPRHSRESGNPDTAQASATAEALDPGLRRDDGEQIRCAFVSTNSVAQGEQVALLWAQLLPLGICIHFAHRTFRWSNEARGKAAVHCVIIGFGLGSVDQPQLFDYTDIGGPPHALPARRINPYLVDAADVLIPSRRQPICDVPHIVFGSMPNDGGHLLLTAEERNALLQDEPQAEPWLRRFMGAREFLNGGERWCLWLQDLPPGDLKKLPRVRARVEAVAQHRASSNRAATQKLAKTPTLFGEIRQPSQQYLMIPSVSSERREFAPVGFQSSDVIASNLCLIVPNAALFHFGVVQSSIHMGWMRTVCGRLKSDFRYTNEIVYNNFPWPEPNDKQRTAIESAAQAVLDARARFPEATLADLYDPLSMPPALRKAHEQLDRAVDAAYSRRKFEGDADRVAFLFERYQEIVSLLPKQPTKTKRRPKSDT